MAADAGLVLAGACGGRDATAPSPGRWVGAEHLDDVTRDAFLSRVGFPTLGIDGSGRAIAAWQQDSGIRYRQFVPGRGWGAPEGLPTAGPGGPGAPLIAVNWIGTAVVVWRQVARPDGPSRVWSSRHAGGQWTPAEPLQAGPGWAQSPVVAIDEEGNALVAWVERAGATASIWVTRFQVDRR